MCSVDTVQIIKKTYVCSFCEHAWKRVILYDSANAFLGEECPNCGEHQTSRKSLLMDLPEGSILVWEEEEV